MAHHPTLVNEIEFSAPDIGVYRLRYSTLWYINTRRRVDLPMSIVAILLPDQNHTLSPQVSHIHLSCHSIIIYVFMLTSKYNSRATCSPITSAPTRPALNSFEGFPMYANIPLLSSSCSSTSYPHRRYGVGIYPPQSQYTSDIKHQYQAEVAKRVCTSCDHRGS